MRKIFAVLLRDPRGTVPCAATLWTRLTALAWSVSFGRDRGFTSVSICFFTSIPSGMAAAGTPVRVLRRLDETH